MSVNKVILVGNLGCDPENRILESGLQVTHFSLATNEYIKGKSKGDNGEQQTTWHRITSYGKTAEFCAQYLKKGDRVYLEGKIRHRKWTDNDGINRTNTEIIVNNVQFS